MVYTEMEIPPYRRLIAKYLIWATSLSERRHGPELVKDFFDEHPLLKSPYNSEILLSFVSNDNRDRGYFVRSSR